MLKGANLKGGRRPLLTSRHWLSTKINLYLINTVATDFQQRLIYI